MRVFLDDIRPAPQGFTLGKTADEAIKLLKTGLVSFLSFDHDLGAEESGYDVVCWLEAQVVEGVLDVPVMLSHSANVPGTHNINRAIAAIRRRSMEQPFPRWGFLREAAGRYYEACGLRLVEKTAGLDPGLFVVGGTRESCIEIMGSHIEDPLDIGAALARLSDRVEGEPYRHALVLADMLSTIEQMELVRDWVRRHASLSLILVDRTADVRTIEFTRG